MAPPTPHRADWMDGAGSLASAACVLHCVALATAPSLLPALGLAAFAGHAHEWVLLVVAAAIAVPAVALGFRAHRSPAIVASFLVGVGLLGASQLIHDHGAGMGLVLAVLGGITLVGAHLANLRQRRVCGGACAA